MTETGAFPELPWGGAEPWQADVAVVGGGPAGLAAALRLRWLKSIPALPLSTVLINSGPMGGLASLGNSILTGPGLAFPSGRLPEILHRDLSAWPLPVLRQRAVGLRPVDGRFGIALDDGRVLRALSLIVATGMLELSNLPDFWGRGVSATFGSAGNVHSILEKTLPGSRKPVVIGGPRIAEMDRAIAAMNPGCRLFIPDCGDVAAEHSQVHSLEVVRGRLLEAVAGESGELTGLRAHLATGERLLESDLILLEFNSLELGKADRLAGLPVTGQGFVRVVDGSLQTPLPGLFAAGDCLGPPFCVAKALGQGVQAAFSAYRFAYEAKYGQSPSLFAYYGDERVLQGPVGTGQPLDRKARPVRLLRESPLDEASDLWSCLDGGHSLVDLAGMTHRTLDELVSLVNSLIQARAVTLASNRGAGAF